MPAYTSCMTLKTAAYLAMAGMIVLTVLLVVDFLADVSAVLRGLLPAMRLVRSIIYVFASATVALFFYTSYKVQR